MSIERREYVGGAAATTLASDITSGTTSISGTALTNWPTGGTGPFFIVLGRGTSAEEKIKCLSRSANTITVVTSPSSGRGADGTTAAAHSAGAALEVCWTADDADQANVHGADTTRDDHTQYLNTTRHDVTARHTFGAALPTPAAPTTSAVGDAAAAGSAAGPARADHTHGREAFATNAVVLGTAAAAGAATTLIRSDATIAAFDATVPTSSAVGDAAAAGSVAKAARRDHTHGREAFAAPTTLATTSTQTTGTATTVNHSDHDHGYPAAAPRGVMGYAPATSPQGSITTLTDLAGLTVTFTAVTGRRYRVTGYVYNIANTNAAVATSLLIREGGSTLQAAQQTTPGANYGLTYNPVLIIQPSAGSHTYKLSVDVSAGTATANAAATSPSFILVEDIGT